MDFKRKLKKLQKERLRKQKNLKNSISMKKEMSKNLISFDDYLDQQYVKRRTPEREKFEEGFEAIKLRIMIQELKKENGQTQ